jgi:hypothetical protein
MDFFEKINITHFIWYLLPGIALIFFIIFPVAFINLDAAVKFFAVIGITGVITFGAVLGFILEGLRLYRYRKDYEAVRKEFFDALKSTLKLDMDVDSYYILSRIKDYAKIKTIYVFELRHALWIMLGQITILAFIEFIFWIVYLIFMLFFSNLDTFNIFNISVKKPIAVAVVVLMLFLFCFIWKRLSAVSTEDQKTYNRMVLDFTKNNASSIKNML